MTNDDKSAAADQNAQRSASDRPARHAGSLTPGQRLRQAGSRRRPWWKWLLIGLLLLFSVAVTTMYLATLTADVLRHHWAGALDASRAAVPAAVGWAALLIIGFTGSTKTERLLSAEHHAVSERERQAARDEDSVRRAERRVRDLTASLAALTAGCGHPGPGGVGREHRSPERADRVDRGPEHRGPPDRRRGSSGRRREHSRLAAGTGPERQLARQVANTTARLDQARQWLTSARAALAASQQDAAAARGKLASDIPDPVERPGPTAGRVA